MSATRAAFVAAFGEEEARCVESAAAMHRQQRSDDPIMRVFADLSEALIGAQPLDAPDLFLLDISTCISWECLSRPKFRAEHGFTVPAAVMQAWVRQHAVPPAAYRDPLMPQLYRAYLGE